MRTYLPFLDFPREVREVVEEYYVLENEGYHFDYASKKLRTSRGPVNLSLMYTCKMIAKEMYGLALKTNLINFRTVCSESKRLKAGSFDRLIRYLMKIRYYILRGAIEGDVLLSLDAETDETPSMHREAVEDALRPLSTDPNQVIAMAEQSRGLWREVVLSPFLVCNPEVWTIPSTEEVAKMEKHIDFEPYGAGFIKPLHRNFWKLVKWRFWAASAAMCFLRSIPLQTRLQIRSIVLSEDYYSTAFPESYALGLLKFCLENPFLHIERRVDVWRTVLGTSKNYQPSTRIYNTIFSTRELVNEHLFAHLDLDFLIP